LPNEKDLTFYNRGRKQRDVCATAATIAYLYTPLDLRINYLAKKLPCRFTGDACLLEQLVTGAGASGCPNLKDPYKTLCVNIPVPEGKCNAYGVDESFCIYLSAVYNQDADACALITDMQLRDRCYSLNALALT
jgi:hypothetical protein